MPRRDVLSAYWEQIAQRDMSSEDKGREGLFRTFREENRMNRRSFMGAVSAVAVCLSLATGASAQDKKFTIALIPGLTTDAFYITMQRGAQAAAAA